MPGLIQESLWEAIINPNGYKLTPTERRICTIITLVGFGVSGYIIFSTVFLHKLPFTW